MKKERLDKLLVMLLALFFTSPLLANGGLEECFVLPENTQESLPIKLCFSESGDYVLNNNTMYTGLAIGGSIVWNNTRGLVRIVLEENNHHYLLLEADQRFHSESFKFSNITTECLFSSIKKGGKLHICVREAQLVIDNIVTSNTAYEEAFIKERLQKQNDVAVRYWNEYLKQNGKLWRAGTNCANEQYCNRMALYSNRNDYRSNGLEYYSCGIIELEEEEELLQNNVMQPTNTTYVSYFDWRNRHGKNWMTSIKNQFEPNNNVSGNGGCWAFGPIAAIEAVANLYYNQLLNIDLSEQEVGSCTSGSLHNGGHTTETLTYAQNNGIVNESCFPFQNDELIPCNNKCTLPDDVVSINGYNVINLNNNIEPQLKYNIIHYGPLAVSINNNFYRHAMCLVGYKVIEAGDTIQFLRDNQSYSNIIIDENSAYIGRTYWIFKDSSGENAYQDGYKYILFDRTSMITQAYSINTPVYSQNYNSTDVVIEDRDGDGFYNWGIGPMPASLNGCCYPEEDADDNDPNIGPIDDFGFPIALEDIIGDIVYSSNLTISSDITICDNIHITNGADVVLQATLTMFPSATIYVENGTLSIESGTINNARIEVMENGSLTISPNASLYLEHIGMVNVYEGGQFFIDNNSKIQ